MCLHKSEGISHLNGQQSASGGIFFPWPENFVASQRKKNKHKILGNANQNWNFISHTENVIFSYVYLWFLILNTVLALLHSVTLSKEVFVESSFLTSLFFLKCDSQYRPNLIILKPLDHAPKTKCCTNNKF